MCSQHTVQNETSRNLYRKCPVSFSSFSSFSSLRPHALSSLSNFTRFAPKDGEFISADVINPRFFDFAPWGAQGAKIRPKTGKKTVSNCVKQHFFCNKDEMLAPISTKFGRDLVPYWETFL